MTADFDEYFAYLKNRSTVGWLYRSFWLYPQLSMALKGRLLDIGCGIGDMLKFQKNAVGVDINPNTVAFCKEQGLEAHVMEIDVLPFELASFDCAILDNVLEHIADPTPLLCETRRVVRPGGRLVVGVPGKRGYDADPDHKVFYDEAALKKRLAEAGFSFHRMMRMPLPGLSKKLRSYCIYGVFVRDDGDAPR